MKLEVGDKLICKENDKTFKDHPLFTVGNSYELVEIRGDRILEYLINIENINWHFCEFNVERYFYSKKELRKQKLQKLCYSK